MGSSPHTRGAPNSGAPTTTRRRIIPAYAGSTPRAFQPISSSWDHPRIRGEHPVVRVAEGALVGSSPHTRGARSPCSSTCGQPRIIPAYAGSTHISRSRRSPTTDHPRIRGEHRSVRPCCRRCRGSSPHTRGAPPSPERPGRRRGIIPAYAGSTFIDGKLYFTVGDHPRIRGEHPPGPATYWP